MAQKIYMASGRMGITPGFYANTNAVTEDNDGEFTDSYYNGVIDLTEIMSLQLGKQLSQMANYRVSFVQIDLRNVNNTLDNDASLLIGGHLQWYSPTKHRVDALQALRDVDRMERRRNDVISAGSPGFPFALSDGKNYTGLRFNWNSDNEVDDAAPNRFSSIFAGVEYNLVETMAHYNVALGGTPEDEGYDTSGLGQALWASRTGWEMDGRDSAYFVTSFVNREQTSAFTDDGETHAPRSTPWTLDLGNRYISVLGGLLHLDLLHSNTDTAGIAEDEFNIQVTLGIEGWEEF